MFEPRRECSMPPDDQARIRHLVEAASKAVSYAARRSRSDLDDDELLRLASQSSSRLWVRRRSTSVPKCVKPDLVLMLRPRA